MSKNKYILETLFYIGFPKIITFLFSLISFPILIRSFGANNYGTVLYISSTIYIFEVLIDFGVPSAAGKSLSIYRVKSPHFIKNEFTTWFKMQLVTILIGVLPLFLVSKYILATTSKFNITNEILVIAIITVLTNAILSFLRPILTSLLAFKFLSILDTVESILRSFSYVMIAFFSPNIIGYLSASLITSILSTILAFTFVLVKINNYGVDNFIEKDKAQFISSYKFNLKVYIGYFFNHDSEFRLENHVNKKIVKDLLLISKDKSIEKIQIGNPEVKKEFNFAGDIVNAVWQFISQEEFFEVVIGSGIAYSIYEWIRIVAEELKVDLNNIKIDVNHSFKSEYNILISNPKIIKEIGWEPKLNIRDLAKRMILKENLC